MTLLDAAREALTDDVMKHAESIGYDLATGYAAQRVVLLAALAPVLDAHEARIASLIRFTEAVVDVGLAPRHVPQLATVFSDGTDKCDGNHGGPRCGDSECWNDDPQGDGTVTA